MIKFYYRVSRKLFYSLILFSLYLPAAARAAIVIDPGEFNNINNPFGCGGLTSIIDAIFGIGCGPAGAETASELIIGIINILLAIVGLLSVLYIIIGGLRYITAHGNEEQAEGAKKTILHAIIGIAVVIMSFVIVRIISNALAFGNI